MTTSLLWAALLFRPSLTHFKFYDIPGNLEGKMRFVSQHLLTLYIKSIKKRKKERREVGRKTGRARRKKRREREGGGEGREVAFGPITHESLTTN